MPHASKIELQIVPRAARPRHHLPS